MLFVGVMIMTLVVTKMGIAWSAARFRHHLEGAAYRWVMLGLGVGLAIFGVLLWAKGYSILTAS